MRQENLDEVGVDDCASLLHDHEPAGSGAINACAALILTRLDQVMLPAFVNGRADLADPRQSCDALTALPMVHKDPFDRMLIAQAIAEGLDFVTNNEHIRSYPVGAIW